MPHEYIKVMTGCKPQAYIISFLACPRAPLSQLNVATLRSSETKVFVRKIAFDCPLIIAAEVNYFIQVRSVNGPLLLRTIFDLPDMWDADLRGFSKPGGLKFLE